MVDPLLLATRLDELDAREALDNRIQAEAFDQLQFRVEDIEERLDSGAKGENRFTSRKFLLAVSVSLASVFMGLAGVVPTEIAAVLVVLSQGLYSFTNVYEKRGTAK